MRCNVTQKFRQLIPNSPFISLIASIAEVYRGRNSAKQEAEVGHLSVNPLDDLTDRALHRLHHPAESSSRITSKMTACGVFT